MVLSYKHRATILQVQVFCYMSVRNSTSTLSIDRLIFHIAQYRTSIVQYQDTREFAIYTMYATVT